MRFHLNCLKYDLESELMDEESSDYAKYSLPPMSDQAKISSSFVSFSSNVNEDSNLNIQIIHDEESPQILGVMHALMQKTKARMLEESLPWNQEMTLIQGQIISLQINKCRCQG